ncbi:MAG: cytochrome c oxidase assembly factor Coa1 family protein [Pyrinomonadaceae bacterium]
MQYGGNQAAADVSGRSRKWIVLIVLFVVVIPILITFGIFAAVIGGLYLGTKSTEEFKCSMAKINENQEAIELLGKPIEDGYLVMPTIEISGPVRRVNFSVPVSGPKGSARLNVNSFRDGFNSNFVMSLRGDDEKNLILHSGKYPCSES